MHFGTKNYLKSTRNHTAKHALSQHVKTAFSSAISNYCLTGYHDHLSTSDFMMRLLFYNLEFVAH
jgi:hypothetical protein